MESESNSKYNIKIRSIVDKLYNLRMIEFSNKSLHIKYKLASNIFSKIIIELENVNNFLLYRPMWEELHDRMVYYYDYLNKENLKKKKVPIFRMILHNSAIIWWLEAKKIGKLVGPLIHFDTHDDMGLPPTTKGLLNAVGNINRKGLANGSCAKIFWPVTCLLLAKGTDAVIWGMPPWIYDDNAGFNQVLVTTKKGDETFYLRSKNEPKDKFMITGDDIKIVSDKKLEDKKTYKFYHPLRFDRIHVDNSSNWKKLKTLIDNDKFILDIDLDYFVCNGIKVSKKIYQKEFTDICSDGRIEGIPGMDTPREMYSDDVSIDIVNKLNKEVKLIKKRIKVFLKGLSMLKRYGIVPCCINISDSTTSLFSGNADNAVFTNQYTPKYFIPLIYNMLVSDMDKLYNT